MQQIEINGAQYRVGKMDARRQFHVMRRLAPLLSTLGPVAAGGLDDPAALAPMAAVLAGLSDEDVDYVLDTCLAVCQRQQGDAWAAIRVPNGKASLSMFADIDMAAELRLTAEAIKGNLGDFFAPLLGAAALPSSASSAPAAAAAVTG